MRLPSLVLIVSLTVPWSDMVGQEHRAGPGQPPSAALPAELSRVLRDYERGWKAGDAAALARLFSEDGMALPSGKPAALGRVAIAGAYGGPGGDLRLRALAWATADTVGYVIGGYRYGPGEGDLGKFVLALKRSATGSWMIAADIDNANARPR